MVQQHSDITKQRLYDSQLDVTKNAMIGRTNSSSTVTQRYRKHTQVSNTQLPAILKRTSSNTTSVKPTPSINTARRIKREDHTADSNLQNHQNGVTKSTITRTTIQPVPVHVYRKHSVQTNATPLITTSNIDQGNSTRDRMIRANLNQKATFKSKSPINRSESTFSRSMMSTTLERTKTPNPFKQIDASLFLNEATRMKLKRLFNQLDTDKDGHLTYPQVKKCLPANMERAQETFFKVLYEITSETTFFGLHEFYSTAVMVDKIHHQDPMLWQLLDDIDFNHYREDMLEYIIEFDACERQSVYNLTQIISFEGLISIISSRTNNSNWFHIKRVYDEFLRFIPRSSSNSNALLTHISRLDYISYIPLFLYVESLLDNAPPLFRFHENSILDQHMQRSKISEHF